MGEDGEVEIMRHVIGLSGGKDSTVLAFALREKEPDTNWEYICTPTGDELPDMQYHWLKLEKLLGKKLIRITNQKAPTLDALINIQQAMPNFRQRWCTRMLNIEPTIAWCIQNSPILMHVGLRADEEEREGIYGGSVKSRFPFREWGWGIKDVLAYAEELRRKFDIVIPERTDCAKCYHQRISEWWNLWVNHRAIFAAASAQEVAIGHTLRSPGRDSWPVSLMDLGIEFQRLWDMGAGTFFVANNIRRKERGLPPLRPKSQQGKKNGEICRVCTL